MGLAGTLYALLAGAFFALGWALQHRAASEEPDHKVGDPRLLFTLLRRRAWLAGRLCAVAGVLAQVMALRHGALSAVQPLMLTGVVFAVPLSGLLSRRPTPRGQLVAVVIGSTGLAAFLLATSPDEGTSKPGTGAWMVVFAVCGGCVGLLLAAASRQAGPARATLVGLATGTLFGLAAALLKADALHLDEGVVSTLTAWKVWVWVGVSALALVLNQSAFQGSSLAAPLTTLVLSEPLVALGIGVGAFGERLHLGGPRLLLVAAGVVAMVAGVRRLTPGMSEART